MSVIESLAKASQLPTGSFPSALANYSTQHAYLGAYMA
jgi:hypothetical protein